MRLAKVIFLGSLTFSWLLIGAYYANLIDDSFLGDSVTWAEEAAEPSSTHETMSKEEIPKKDTNHLEDGSELSNPPSDEVLSSDNSSQLVQDFSEGDHVFTIEPIPSDLIKDMEKGNPIDSNSIDYDRLRLVTVTHYGFDHDYHQGQLIVHREVAHDIIEIFKEVLEIEYPIEKIKLLEEYGYSDRDSMADNNSSAFNFRTQTNSDVLSMHAYGLAIDINPVQNPYVYGDYFLPTNAMLYLDRSKSTQGMIQKGDALYHAFVSRGWTWGGDWTHLQDYQHFEKRID